MSWLCLELEIVVLFQRMARPRFNRIDVDALAYGARCHRLTRKATNTRRWYARNRTAQRARGRARVRDPEERRRTRRRWYEKLKADPARYQTWLERQRC